MLIPDPTNSETTQLSIQRILGCSSGIYIFEDAPKWILMQVVPSLCEECWLRTCKAIRNQCHLNKLSFKKYKGRKRKHIITEMLKDKLVSFFHISCLSFHRILEEMTACFCGPSSPHEFQVGGARLCLMGLGLRLSLSYKLDGLDLVSLGLSTGSC